MSNNQLAGFPAFGSRVDTRITYNPVSYIPESPLPLPASQPGTAQLQFTINAASLPTYSPVEPKLTTESLTMAQRYTVATIMGFYNNAATAQYISMYYKRAKPSTFSQGAYTQNPVAAGKYRTLTYIGTMSSFDLNDVHEVKVHGGTTEGDISLLWAYMIVIPSSCVFYSTSAITNLLNLEITMSQASWIGAASVATPSAGYRAYSIMIRIPPAGNATQFEIAAISNVTPTYSTTSSVEYMLKSPTNNTGYGAYDAGDRSTDDKYHFQIYYPTRIAYTPIL